MTYLLALLVSYTASASTPATPQCRQWAKSVLPARTAQLENPEKALQEAQLRLDRRTQVLLGNFLEQNQMEEDPIRHVATCATAYGIPKMGYLDRAQKIVRSASTYEVIVDSSQKCQIDVGIFLFDGFNEDIVLAKCTGDLKLESPVLYHGSVLSVLMPK